MRRISAAALVLCACGPAFQSGGTGIHLRADPTAAGDSIVLTLANRSTHTIGYNLCATGIEQRVDDGWQAVPTDRACTMELRTLQAGSEATYTTTLPPGTPPGEYRFRTNVQLLDEGDNRLIPSNVVRVS